MSLPPPKKRARMGVREPDRIVSPGHDQWIRSKYICLIAGKPGHECAGCLELHHTTSRGAGGGDETLVPYCTGAHMERHQRGRDSFESKYGINERQTAADLWRADTYHRLKHERKQQQQTEA